jgi:hypothetical protein
MLKNNGFHNRHSPLPFSPASLFANGEQGLWYDPSNFATLFQDSAGTTPVTAVEQPVGLQLDLSGRGNHALQSTSANRPVVSARVNLFVGTATLATQSVTTRATAHTLTFTGAGSITLTGTAIGTYTAGTYSVTTTAGTLTATVLGTVTQADLRETSVGVGLPAYQAVVTSTNYDSTSFPVYLRFDGADDSLVCSSLDRTAWTDAMCVTGGMSISSIGAYVDGLNSSGLASHEPFSDNNWYCSFGSNIRADSITSLSYRTRYVLTRNRASGTTSFRRNGANTAITAAGTTNYGGTSNVFIGRNAGGGFLNGQLYSLIVRGAASTAAQITQTETWVNTKTKAY